MMENWQSQHIEEVFSKLSSSKDGLTKEKANLALKKYGKNIISSGKKLSLIEILLNQFKNFIIYVLLFAAAVSFITGEQAEFIIVSIIILVVILTGFFEEYKAGKEMEALKKLTPRMARVCRRGKFEHINAEDLVPGDVIELDRGDIIPADCRIISVSNVHVDESNLTGESVPVTKKEGILPEQTNLSEQHNMVFASTLVTNGNGQAIVVGTSKSTEIGKVGKLISDIKEEETPLQNRLNKLSKQLSIAVFFTCVLILVTETMRGMPIEHVLLLSIAVAVAGIPESLPTVIAVTLAFGVKRMAKRNAIIKKMYAVETLGTCSVICTDKTGTLTQNKMVVESIFTADAEVGVTGKGFEPKGFFMIEGKNVDPRRHKTVTKVLEIGVFCNNSELKKSGEEWEIEGEPTEGAIVVMAEKAGLKKNLLHKQSPRIKEHPFDADRKCMSTVHLVKKKQMVYSKGAPELLLQKAHYYFDEGVIKKINPQIKKIFISKTEEYASKGMRVLGLAFKEHNLKKYELKHIESRLVFVGVVAMRDPPGENVEESVKVCQEAGTKVVMITGDNKTTARAIAQNLGIFKEGDHVIEGHELEAMQDHEFLAKVESVSVYARTTPKHKLRIVETLQKKGNVVAMTGDGVNDAPALKKADIGIAMGKRGTEVAKEAAEMVIKDDNFSTIVSAMKEGRTIYTNIRKFIYFSLTTNIAEVMLILIAVLLSMNPPLTALMILFLNLITGDFPALALSMEKAPKGIMKQKPRNPKESILSDYLMLKIANVVPLIVLGTISLYMWEIVIRGGTIEKAQTIAFVTLIMFELFHVFNAKSWDESAISKDSVRNVFLNAAIVFSGLFMFLVVYFPPLQNIFGTVPLGWIDLLMILGVTSTIIIYNEIQKTVINAEIGERKKQVVYDGKYSTG